MSHSPILRISVPLGFQWETADPFSCFCVHHRDAYPAGNGTHGGLRPFAPPGGRIGQDFEGKDGWRMYHRARRCPAFPRHPHRGLRDGDAWLRQGLIDHSDSLGAHGRAFGPRATCSGSPRGRAIEHSEMFHARAGAVRTIRLEPVFRSG